MAATAACYASRGLAAPAVRPCPSPSLAMRHVALPSSSWCCPVSIRGARLQLPCPLIPDGGKSVTSKWRTMAEARGKPEAAGIPRTLQLGTMILVWYLLNMYFNIYNKLVLKAVPFPYTITTFQFASGSFFITLMWLLNLHPMPRLSLQQYGVILPLAIMNMLGNAFTNMSLGKVAVSFTHTIKAMEPFFSVLLSALFLGQTPSFLVVGSLVPVVGGVVLASMTEVSFNWIGFWSAMASNLTLQSRNVISKKLLSDKEETLDDINLFSILTVMSFLLSVPLMLYVEGIKFSPLYLQSTGVNLRELCLKAVIAGACFHFNQQVSYSLLARISPVTHSVANSLKRVAVIVSSVIFFGTPISPINSLGTAVALLGVILYSRLIKAKSKAKTS